jgi:hypothetical protein
MELALDVDVNRIASEKEMQGWKNKTLPRIWAKRKGVREWIALQD